MKVIDQINGSALFSQSAYSASVATKDSLGRDITATYLTGIDLGDYYKKTETSSKEEISAAIDSIPQGDPDVNNFVQTNSSTIVDVDNVVQTNSGAWGGGTVGDFVPTSAIGYGVIFDDNLRLHPTAISGYSIYAPSARDSICALTANSAYRAQMDKDGYWIDAYYVKYSAFNYSASYLNNAINYISSVTTPTTDRTFLSGAIDYVSGAVDYVSANCGKTYTGVAPIQVNNTSNEISITGESISAGPGIDIFSSGGYVVISGDGAEAIKNISAGEGILVSSVDDKTIITNNISAGQGISLVYDNETNKIRIDVDNFNDYELSAGNGVTLTDDNVNKITRIDCTSNGFPITGTDGTANYTANANFSSFSLTTGQGAAGCFVNLDAKDVRYEAYPSTDVSASWYNIITATNNRGNCYCIRFTNDMTAADLANYSAYDKVTVVHSNEYAQDCHLYWNGNTKVFPSGLYCELVKGTNDQNQIDWLFTTSGWTNNLWWDWD